MRRYGRNLLLVVFVPDCYRIGTSARSLEVGHADNETSDEYLPSQEELLDRNKDGTEMKLQCQSQQQQITAQVPDSIDDSALEIRRRAA